MMKRVVLLCLSVLLAAGLLGCAGGAPTPTPAPTGKASATSKPEKTVAPDVATDANYDPALVHVVITMADGGVIQAELYPEIAPIAVTNFQKLVKAGFYNGLTFHRVIKDFMIQGGAPNGTDSPGKIKGEFSANGVKNELLHTRGVLSMARVGGQNNSASSQFFIMHADYPSLDGQYAAFGKVTEGMDVVDKIAVETPVTDSNGTVAKENQPVIASIVLK